MTSSTDPGSGAARVLALLWREPGARTSTRGPRQGLSVDAVVAAAIELADSAGLEALTMRRVAQALGVAPMSLYTYVPGKAELLDLMLDAVYGRMPYTETAGLPWRERLAAVARDNRALCDRHPWVALVSAARPPLGPGLMAKYERELLAFDGLGLDDVEMDDALAYLLGFVQASARASSAARALRRESAITDEEWWAANEPLLARIFDATRYPTAARVGSAAGEVRGTAFDPDHAYRFGLERVLDGLGVLIEARDR
ncbi:TetR/AcrR family transcriptional regulator [Rhizohabitans arisaemae]|uniref:TetR/AcrR family transcriptional regulator n=1 Tax=Rhizohabitans arisaemae TaxID=2720610 RepID=UPI0024B0A156|nr:TetR/AcrR family transcriptional regulator [Rhizohabitans arisaemae]